VALVERMALQNGMNPNDQASIFAEHLHNTWGVGHAACSNGMVLFLSLQDRAFGLSVGDGLDKILTQQRRQAVLDSMKPALRAGDTAGGIETALLKVYDILSKHLTASAPQLGGIAGTTAAGTQSAAGRKLNAQQGDDNSSSSGGSGGGGGDGRFTGKDSTAVRPFTSLKPDSSSSSSGSTPSGSSSSSARSDLIDALKNAGLFLEKQVSWLLPSGVVGLFVRDVAHKREMASFQRKMAAIQETHRSGLPNAAAAAAVCPICLQEFKQGDSPAHNHPYPDPTSSSSRTIAAAAPSVRLGCDGKHALELGCGHAFCHKCLQKWLKKAGAHTCGEGSPCPICDPSLWQASSSTGNNSGGSGGSGGGGGFFGWLNDALSGSIGQYSSGTNRGPAFTFQMGGRSAAGGFAKGAVPPRATPLRTQQQQQQPVQQGPQGALSSNRRIDQEDAFKLRSLQQQYPKYLGKQELSQLLRGEPTAVRGRKGTPWPLRYSSGNSSGSSSGKANRWVQQRPAQRSSSSSSRYSGSSDRSWGGGSSSSSTGGGW
jgi:TPM domain/Zinc finger, C3HC4 type (RING finger)